MVKSSVSDLAVFGGHRVFEKDRVVGQVYLPPRKTFDTWFDAIFERQYYANHGPLVTRLDEVIAERLDVGHAVSVTNGTVALMVALTALELTGDVVVPAYTFPATIQALFWTGLRPVFADVDPETHMLTPETVAKALTPETSGVVGVHVWGRACAPLELHDYCRQKGVRLLFDACHAFGCSHGRRMMGNFGDAEVFSFHATKIVNGAEGGCITTNDSDLAAKLKTIRNFHRSPMDQDVAVRINGKMTEAQAAMALMSLSDFEIYVDKNRAIYDVYRRSFSGRSDVRAVEFDESELNNYQYAVFELDDASPLSRDELLSVLRSEGVLARRYFAPGVHKLFPYNKEHDPTVLPVTDKLCDSVFQLPVGAQVTPAEGEMISELVNFVLDNAGELKARLAAA